MGINTKSLIKVVYAEVPDGLKSGDIKSYKDHLVYEWCKENCIGRWWRNPGWCDCKFIEFANEDDATMFALRWG
jgi:hypothetical protein